MFFFIDKVNVNFNYFYFSLSSELLQSMTDGNYDHPYYALHKIISKIPLQSSDIDVSETFCVLLSLIYYDFYFKLCSYVMFEKRN